jgi:DNA mismatch repair ATPase MutL
MSMDSLCITNISTLPASPSKEPVFILSSDQLQEIISHAITQALEEMQGASPDALNGQEKLQQLIEGQAQEIKALKSVIQTLLERAENQENTQERDVDRIYCDIAQDRQRIAKLERPPEPQPTQRDRAEILRALLAANGGKMLAKDARKKMHLRKELFSPLLKKCDFIEVKPLHSDGRKKIIILKG